MADSQEIRFNDAVEAVAIHNPTFSREQCIAVVQDIGIEAILANVTVEHAPAEAAPAESAHGANPLSEKTKEERALLHKTCHCNALGVAHAHTNQGIEVL